MRILILLLLSVLPAFANYATLNCVLLDASATTLTVTNSGSVGGTTPKTFSPGAGERVRYCVTPIFVPPSTIGTKITASITAGSRTVTPVSMAGITPNIKINVNTGGSAEVITVTSITATTFTATFANSHTGPVLVDGNTYAACAAPCTSGVSVNQQWGQQYDFYEYVDSTGLPFFPRKIAANRAAYDRNACGGIGTLPHVEVATITTNPMPMPIEVIGQDCYVTARRFPLDAGHSSSSQRAYLRIYSPGYNSNSRPDGKVSIKVNNGEWITLTNSVVSAVDEPIYKSADLKGIGSWAQTREFTVPLVDGTIGGADTTVDVRFRFNGTEGIGSGYYVLAFNIVEANKTITTLSIASNVASAAVASHGYSSGNTVLIQNGMGTYHRSSGARTITGITSAGIFTFAPCGTSLTRSSGCTSPDITTSDTRAFPPINRDTSGFRSTTQEVMYAARGIIPATAFTATDPFTWTAPGGGDPAIGENLFKFGNEAGTPDLTDQLVNPVLPYFDNKLRSAQSQCAGCHFQGDATQKAGGDLKLFNYSNNSIAQRVYFHGLPEQAGLHIAAYIRGLATPAAVNGAPWNPPFQPGPGLSNTAWHRSNSTLTSVVSPGTTTMTVNFSADPGLVVNDPLQISNATVDTDLNTQKCIVLTVGSNTVTCGPVANVAAATYTESTLMVSAPLKLVAGCGIDCVINDGYASLLEYMAPGGSRTTWAWDSRLPTETIPFVDPFATWAQWLPVHHPSDAFPPYDFAASTCYTRYQDILTNMAANSFSAWAAADYTKLWGAEPGSDDGFCSQTLQLGGDPSFYQPGQLPPSNLSTRFWSGLQYIQKAQLDVMITKGTLCFDGLRVQATYGGSATPNPNWPVSCGINNALFFDSGWHKRNLDGVGTGLDPWVSRIQGMMDGGAGTHAIENQAWYFSPFVIGAGNGHEYTYNPIDPAYLTGLNNAEVELRPNGWISMIPAIAVIQAGNQWLDFENYRTYGMVTTSGTTVTWDSGATFPTYFQNGTKILLTESLIEYTVSSRTSDTVLVLTTSAGTNVTPISYYGPVQIIGTDWTESLRNQFLFRQRWNFLWMSDADRAQYMNDWLDLTLSMLASHDTHYWISLITRGTTTGAGCCNAADAWPHDSGGPYGAQWAKILTFAKMWGADTGKIAAFKARLETFVAWFPHDWQIDIDAANDGSPCTIGMAPNALNNGVANQWWQCSNMIP